MGKVSSMRISTAEYIDLKKKELELQELRTMYEETYKLGKLEGIDIGYRRNMRDIEKIKDEYSLFMKEIQDALGSFLLSNKKHRYDTAPIIAVNSITRVVDILKSLGIKR
jgi:hypothetical protein